MTMYAQVEDTTGYVAQTVGRLDPDGYAGPLEPAPDAVPGYTFYQITQAPDWRSRPSATSQLVRNVDGTLAWVETAPIADTVAKARARIDSKANGARMAVLVESTKDLEYTRAAEVARPFKDAGYVAPVPEAVQSWADARKWRNGGVPWTAQQAADNIVAQADRYNGLLDGIRRLRLDAMEHCLAIGEDPAGTHDQVKAVEDQFDNDLNTLMGGVQ